MATLTSLRTFRNPVLSLWQSAVHSTLLQHAVEGRVALPHGHHGLGRTADHPHMQATVQALENLERRKAVPVPPASLHALEIDAAAAPAVLSCAEIAAEIAWDSVFHKDRVPDLENELKFNICDPFWTEALAAYAAFKVGEGTQPYTPWTQLSDFVLDTLPNPATVAILSDWGTGMNDAEALLRQVAQFKPQVLIHLGDIYYSGLPNEDTNNFLSLVQEVFGSSIPVYTLSGNHDRYAGNLGGLFPLMQQLGQPSTYFALRNQFWQLLAMDTGLHDADPLTVNSNVTYLEQREIAWHLDKLQQSATDVNASSHRGTVLLSHHQPISFTGVGEDGAGNPLAVNPQLFQAFAPVLDQVDLWLWGHEHDLCIFERYALDGTHTLRAGRCIGAGAVPTFTPLAEPPIDLVCPAEGGVPQVIPGTRLGDNGTVLNHSYTIANFDDATLTAAYYQFNSTDASPTDPPPAPAPTYKECWAKPGQGPVRCTP